MEFLGGWGPILFFGGFAVVAFLYSRSKPKRKSSQEASLGVRMVPASKEPSMSSVDGDSDGDGD